MIRPATDRDLPRIRSLLESCGLPTADLGVARPDFLVACEGPLILAAGAIERFGQTGLLRSLAVVPERRGEGVGRALVTALEAHARGNSLRELVLLTQTARPFFADCGYQAIDREDAPVAVQPSEEFRSLCPASACCMTKRLPVP